MARAETEFARAETAGVSLDRAVKDFISAVFSIFLREMSESYCSIPITASNARELAMTFLWDLTGKVATEKMGFNEHDGRFLRLANEIKSEAGASPKFEKFMAQAHEAEFTKTWGTCEAHHLRVGKTSREAPPLMDTDEESSGNGALAAERSAALEAYKREALDRDIKIGDKDVPKESRKAKKPVRRNQKYKVIDEALQAIAESRPRTQKEVFQCLEKRHVVTPPAEPFMAASG